MKKAYDIGKFIKDQLSLWPEACGNFRSLRDIRVRMFDVGGLPVVLQHNPARIVSSAAKLDAGTLKNRKCFLCAANRPEEQTGLEFEGRKGRKYDILVNPYPILRNHLVIAMKEHCAQSIWRRFVDMLDFAAAYPDFSVFYNGPQCGASAPDHHHFQAASKGQLSLENDVNASLDTCARYGKSGNLEFMTACLDADMFLYRKYLPGIFVIKGSTSKSVAKLFYRLLDCAERDAGRQPEPMCNVFVWHSGGEFRCIVVLRSAHRSHHYFSQGDDHLTMSPGCADMAGCLVSPVAAEFERTDAGLLREMLEEVALDRQTEAVVCRRLVRTQKEVSVGIMSGDEIGFEILSDGAGPRKAVFKAGKIEYDGSLFDELYFEAKTLSTMFAEPSFRLYGVTIGVGFHWERREDQQFAGALKVIAGAGSLVAVNVVGVEDYLVSVISSEMKSSSPPEFLKAHAVISRSWLMKQMGGRDFCRPRIARVAGNEVTRWYCRSDHDLFDVCADDHCQRYQGLTEAAFAAAKDAVDATWGQVLAYGGKICDARFSKCCGGVTEKFSSCWEDVDYDYLQGLSDTPSAGTADLSDETAFRTWLSCGNDSFCGKASPALLARILNSYDMETADFFRWQVRYRRGELSRIFAARSGMDIGEIRTLTPLSRGASGRIVRLEVAGTLGTVIIGKELEIRRVLSESHLKSSAFIVDYDGDDIVLTGAGWGHGVGLCQIGAAEMAAEGYDYRSILAHYYPGAELVSYSELEKRS